MFHMYAGYHWFGMHLLWWLFWFAFIGMIFGVYEPVPRKRRPGNERP
jgi:putative membrane protein